MVQFRELDDRVPFAQQLGESGGPIVFMNIFHVAPEDVDAFMEARTADGEFMKQQPGLNPRNFIAGSPAARPSSTSPSGTRSKRSAPPRAAPEFQASLARYPDSAVASPHIFNKVAVPGISAG